MIMTLLQAVGLRGFLGALAGAVVVCGPAFWAGEWGEAARCDLRIDLALMEQADAIRQGDDDAVDRTAEARRDAGRRDAGGGLRDDDGWRID